VRLDTILERLAAFGVPFALFEFQDSAKNPAPEPPFIVWLKTVTARGPDCGPAMLEQVEVAIELYTAFPDSGLESRLEGEILAGVEFKKFQTGIESENLIQTAYEFTILQKRSITP
jgi:hypothetical protein